jgi:hypothetical protein
MAKETVSRKTLIIVFVLALVVRLGVAWKTAEWSDPEAYEYGEIAMHLVQGEGYRCRLLFLPSVVTCVKPPLYPFFLAGMIKVFGDSAATVVIVIQIIASALACPFLIKTGELFFRRRSALLGGVFLALYPHAAYYVKNIQPQTFSILVILGIVYLTAKISVAGATRKRILGLGALYGVAALLETTLCAFFPVSLWVVWKHRGDEPARRGVVNMAFLAGVAALVIAPWTVRNAVVFRSLIPVRCDFGLLLYLGNAEFSTGSLWTEDGGRIWDAIPEEEQETARNMPLVESNRMFRKKAAGFMLGHPVKTVKRFIVKTAAFWSPVEWGTYGHRSGSSGRGRFPLVRQLVWAGPFIFGVLGLMFALLRKPKAAGVAGEGTSVWLLVGLFLLYPLVYGLTVVETSRYRLVMEPFFLLLAAHFLAEVLPGFPKVGQSGEGRDSSRSLS